MPSEFAIFVFIVVAVLIVVGAYVSHQNQQKRRSALQQFASQRGWHFHSERDGSHDGRYSCFSIFTQGHSRYAFNTIRGSVVVAEASWPVQLGDFHYQTTSNNGKRTTTHTHLLSYLLVQTPYLGAPQLFIRGEGFFDRIASAIGFDDIDFESVEFSEQFIVKCPDKRFAYDVVHPGLMEFMLSSSPPTIDFNRGECCLHRGQRVWSVDEFAATLDWSIEFFRRWPRHVIADLASRRVESNQSPSH